MNYLKLLNARRRGGPQPTMEPLRLTAEQKKRSDAGCCIDCGRANTGSDSYLCKSCQGKETIDAIRDEIAALRRNLLNR